METRWHLAQCNIARLLLPFDDPRLSGFFDELARVNAIADQTSGFVWRLQDDSGDAMALAPTPDPQVALNMSVWEDAEALFDFVYRSAHTPVMARRRQWIEPWDGRYQALWWIPAGHIPSIDEALGKLWLLERYGPSAHAFTFKARFPAPGTGGTPIDMRPEPWCIGTA